MISRYDTHAKQLLNFYITRYYLHRNEGEEENLLFFSIEY